VRITSDFISGEGTKSLLRLIYAICIGICIGLVSLPAVCRPAAKYEVATITDVRLHDPAAVNGSPGAKYDVSVQVADTLYLVLYTDSLGASTIEHAAGRQLLVHVEKNTITYNDILGRSQKVQIISQKPAHKN
jgi:hypothetical protein